MYARHCIETAQPELRKKINKASTHSKQCARAEEQPKHSVALPLFESIQSSILIVRGKTYIDNSCPIAQYIIYTSREGCLLHPPLHASAPDASASDASASEAKHFQTWLPSNGYTEWQLYIDVVYSYS